MHLNPCPTQSKEKNSLIMSLNMFIRAPRLYTASYLIGHSYFYKERPRKRKTLVKIVKLPGINVKI